MIVRRAAGERERVRFVSDEIYHGLDYAFAAETAAKPSARALVINSFSKYFCMTGWRLGWLVVPEEYAREVEKLAQNLYIAAPTLAQHARHEDQIDLALQGGVKFPGHIR